MDKDEKAQLEREVNLRQAAFQVLHNEAYKMAFIARKAQLFDTFCNTKADQVNERDEAWRTMQNLLALEEYFETAITTGKMAEEILDESHKFN